MLRKFNNFLKKFWPLITIVLLWIIFSSPYLFQNRVPFASTYLVNFFAPWNAYPGFASPVKNNAMPDVISQIYPWKELSIDLLKSGHIPLWNPYSFSGTSHLASYQTAVFSPFNLIFFALPFIDAWSLLVLLQPLLAGIFMYLLLKALGLENHSVTIGSISFMFCGFITTWMGYATLGYAILFLPLIFFAIENFYKKKNFKYLILLSFTMPLSFFSGHFQISIYFLLASALFILYKFIETREKNTTFLSILYLFFGLLLTLPQVLPSLEAYSQSLRSSIYQKVEVIPWGYLVTLLAPDILGNPVTRNDWFGHYAEWNGFAGTVTIILSLYLAFVKRTKTITFFVFLLLVSIILSFQSPIIDFLVLLKIPVLSTSAASRAIVLLSFSISVLGAFGFNHLINDIKNKGSKTLTYWTLLIFLIFATVWGLVLLGVFIPVDKISIARQNLILPSLLVAVAIAALWVLRVVLSRRLNALVSLLPLLIVLIVSFDMLRFAAKWQPFDPKSLVFPNLQIESFFETVKPYERVLGNLGSEAALHYRLSSVEGYDAVYNKRYGQFIETIKNGDVNDSERSVVLFPKQGLHSQEALNLLGVKYVAYKLADGRASWAYPFWNYPNSYNLVYKDPVYEVYENKEVYPRAFLVGGFEVQTDPQEIANAMYTQDHNLRNFVILEKNPELKPDYKTGSANLISYETNMINIETNADGNSILFLSDAYYPGWKAYVDGEKTEIYRANYAFRAVSITSGKHYVRFIYEPESLRNGLLLALLGFIVIFVGYFSRSRIKLSPTT